MVFIRRQGEADRAVDSMQVGKGVRDVYERVVERCKKLEGGNDRYLAGRGCATLGKNRGRDNTRSRRHRAYDCPERTWAGLK